MADNRRYSIVPRRSWWWVLDPAGQKFEEYPTREEARKRMYELNGWKYNGSGTNRKSDKKRF